MVLEVLTRGSRGKVPGKKKEGTAGGISGGGSFSLDEKGCLVKKIEGLGEDLWCLEKEGAS